MFKLQYMNVIREVATEIEKDNLIAEGYVLLEDTHTTDATNEISENEISQDTDISEEQSEDNTDETDEEENKAGKKSGKAKK